MILKIIIWFILSFIYFPNIVMPKCNLIKNNIDEDLYISKLSNFFFNYKIGFEIKIITSEDEKKIFNQFFY